jgi:hypothetical protein
LVAYSKSVFGFPGCVINNLISAIKGEINTVKTTIRTGILTVFKMQECGVKVDVNLEIHVSFEA